MLTKAAEQGDAEAQRELGNCYDKGYGVPKDEKKAAYWYNKAAEREKYFSNIDNTEQ